MNNNREPRKDAIRISLGGKRATPARSLEDTVVEPGEPASTPPKAIMTMEQLRNNYEAIIKAGAIYYPVAYQFLRELGRGRQGIVFLGLRQGARGCVTEHAIKVFDPALYHTPEEYWTDMGRIASQVSRLQAIQSPYIVSRHAYDETYGIGYSQMEAIDGVDLRSFLSTEHLELARRNCSKQEWARFTTTIFNFENDRVQLRVGAVVYIMRRILRGLERLHDANFLHSDVKPGNVMIDRLGNVRLVDFGRAVMAGERVTFLFGSPMYMAPETHRREPGGYYSDLYSAGLVGLEMLRGEPLTDGSVSDEEELLRIKTDLPDNLFEMLPHSVRRRRLLIRILRRLVEPDPSVRFQTAREAESGDDGLVVVDKQFTKAGMDAQYGRELGDYLSKLVDTRTQRVEVQPGDTRQGSSSGIII